MQLTNYIQHLLYRHDCVIVPNFGGFISNKIGARIENETTFYPPFKKLGFNSNLIHNDGLLANEIAADKNISFDEATALLSNSVSIWLKELESSKLVLENLGTFERSDENKIVFYPSNTTNYLTTSFGLTKVTKQQIEVAKAAEKTIPVFVKYAATAVIVLALGTLGWQGYEQQQQNKEVNKKQEQLQKKIQSATFVIDNPLPTLEVEIEPTKKPYHIIAGAFQFEENAEKKVRQLKRKGYNSFILEKNKWGLTPVAYNAFSSKDEAYKALSKIRKEESKEAWMFIEKN